MITYDYITPTPLANTAVCRVLDNDVHKGYRITPDSGYVLHDNARDWQEKDPEILEMITKLGFTRGTATCGANYDFTANPRAFYAVLATDVPADQIFGGGTPATTK